MVVVTCERPDYLESALDSIFCQTFSPIEVIVINDASRIDYSETLNKFADRDIVYRRLEKRSGANFARNTGVMLAKGDIVAFLDDDDIWYPHFLQRHLDSYMSEADAVTCGFDVMGSDEFVINPSDRVTPDKLKSGNNFSGMSSFSAFKELLLHKRFDEELTNGQDWDLFVRIAIDKKLNFVNIPESLFMYRRGSIDGITSKVKKMDVKDARLRLGSIYKHRAWLGEKNFRARAAQHILAFLPRKKNRVQWIIESIRVAGFRATVRECLKEGFKKII